MGGTGLPRTRKIAISCPQSGGDEIAYHLARGCKSSPMAARLWARGVETIERRSERTSTLLSDPPARGGGGGGWKKGTLGGWTYCLLTLFLSLFGHVAMPTDTLIHAHTHRRTQTL